MLRKALSGVLASALCLVSLPVGAQDVAPNTIWGEVPRDHPAASFESTSSVT